MEFNDVQLQYRAQRDEIDGAVAQALGGGRYILGPAVASFEEEFSRYCGTAIGVGVASGTDAISIGLRALGVQAGDDVLVPALSAPATAIAVALIGARPVFVDISLEDFLIDPVQANERKTSRTKAIVPVHLYGMPAPLRELGGLRVPVVEDAAQAHGSDARWGRCGSFGDAAAFSFYPTKNLGGYGDGGMIVTSDSKVGERARLLRDYGQSRHYSSEVVGHNSRLDELQAAILRVKLKTLDESNRRRRDVAGAYRAAFRELPVRMQAERGTSNYHLFVIATPNREKLRAHLASLDIPTLVHYPVPLHRQKAFAEFNPASCPNADVACSQLLSLPMHAYLSDGEVQRVIEGIAEFFKR